MIGETEFKVTAVLDTNGATTVTVSGICAYGDRTAHVSTNVENEKVLADVAKILSKTIEGVREEVTKQVTADALEAASIALKRREDIGI